ncbi:DUF1631 domain-containing protein [Methylococcus sp. EFPC2]|uniref:DUF1631 domain-containing protein n=1 Tax=Methylococcus sp. EFPC2 TaxID=2812648 RepID=UPI00196803BE|nr:DUF1631 domain-containing protein [Methylococcus sp. EFPC2]QSA98784.1 DUF1631 domain-containing protein [Methylococcus sp. EFPC2]
MVTQESKVVSFESLQAKQRDAVRRSDSNRLIAECRSIFKERTEDLLQSLFAQADDELFKLSDKAENANLQTVYFDSMRYVRRERESIEQNYTKSLLERYDEFWRHRAAPFGVIKKAEPQPRDEDDFELMENANLEENLAINTLVQKGNNLFHLELFGLNKRFGALLNRDEIALENNPLAPAALCHTFESVVKPHDIDLKVKLLIYKLFDRAVVSAYGTVYHEINSYLIGEGVLPSIARTIKRHPGGTSPEPGQTAQRITRALEEAESGDSSAYLEAFQAMQSLLDGWRTQLGIPSYASAAPDGVVVEPGEVLNALSVLQQPAPWPGGERMAGGEGLKLFVANQLGKLQADDQKRPLGRLEEDIIDMVAMIFDFILEDRNLPDPVKALIARLQIPVVKVAILEKSFFARKNHPARVLLNSLAQAGLGLDIIDSTSNNPVFKKIEEVVGRILAEFDQNVELFAELLADISQFLERDEQRSQIAEERTRQTTQSREQLLLAKKQVAYEIAQKVHGKNLPEVALSFLYNAWKDVLVLAWLRRDKEPEQWLRSLDLVETLIKTATVPVDTATRQELVQSIPLLLKNIKEGLESISYDPAQTTQVLRDLQTMHVHCLRAQPGAETLRKAASVTIRDPELAEAIQVIKANLPDIDDIDMEEASGHIPAGLPDQEKSPADEFDQRAEALPIGEWLEFSDVGPATLRAKLSWKSHVTSLYVFVSRKGVKVAEMSMEDLAMHLRAGTAKIIEGSGVPLMDRALSALMQTLKSPALKSEATDLLA